MILRSKETGELVVVDTFKRRSRLVEKRLYEWQSEILDFEKRSGEEFEWWGLRLSYDGKKRGMRKGDVRELVAYQKRAMGKSVVGHFYKVETHKKSVAERGPGEGRARFSDSHVHMILVVKKGTRVGFPDREGGGWIHGATRREKLVRKSGGYLVGGSYLGKDKEYQNDYSRMIKGIRVFGCSRPKGVRRFPKSGERPSGFEFHRMQREEDHVRR